MIGLHLPAGTKLVCINDAGQLKGDGLSSIQAGQIYTLRGYQLRSDGDFGVFLDEITNPLHPHTGREIGFYRFRFNVAQPLPASILECLKARPKRVNKRQRENA